MSHRPYQPRLPLTVEVEDAPIPGTHLHRCRQGGREIRPVYRGPGGPDDACREADSLGLRTVECDDGTYERITGRWLRLILD